MSEILLFRANGFEARWDSARPIGFAFKVWEGERLRGSYRSEDAAVRAAKRFAKVTAKGRDAHIVERLRNHTLLMAHLQQAEGLSINAASRRAFRILRGVEQ